MEALQEAVGIPNSRYEEERLNGDKTAVREAFGLEADARARAAGRALALDTAVSEALALADELVRNADSLGPLNSAVETSRESGAGAGGS